jgi:serine protease Do
MNGRILIAVAGTAVLGLVLAALPSHSSTPQIQETQVQALRQQVDELGQQVTAPESGDFEFSSGDASWLGVETNEVTAQKAKELALPAERGVMLGKIVENSPASKAGLKENDVVTEINGQRVEGTAQFRRMIREVPPGRAVQFTVWRDGRAQQITATLGKADDGHSNWFHAAPGAFAFKLPNVSELGQLPEIDFDGNVLGMNSRPRLGIDAEDLSGQLGNFFGVPDGEGILVRDVNADSVAQKAGLKAGDVIVSMNGERLRSVGDLRAKLAARDSDKATSVKLGLIRNKSEMSATVELPPPAAKSRKTVVHQTNI